MLPVAGPFLRLLPGEERPRRGSGTGGVDPHGRSGLGGVEKAVESKDATVLTERGLAGHLDLDLGEVSAIETEPCTADGPRGAHSCEQR